MNIEKKIYLKGLIEMATISRGWDRAQVSKKIMYCYKNNCLNDFARFARGKYSYQKAKLYYEQGKMKKFA
jgi:hypothetical protein